MTGFLLTFVLIMIVTMVLIQAVTVRVIYRDELVIRIDFLIFELILYPSRNKKPRKKEKSRMTRIRKGVSSAAATRRALAYLFSRSQVIVREIDIAGRNSGNPAQLAIASQHSRTIITVILAYLSSKSQSLVTQNTPLIISDNEDEPLLTVDVSLVSTLLRLISSFVIYHLNVHGYKRNRRRKIV